MAITKPSRSMLSTGISDSSDATFLTADSSENATFAGNLTVSGNLTVTGTTTQVDTVTMNAQNAVLFEGATADAHETTLTTVDPTGDRTISLPNVSGTLPVLAAASVTQITSTPEELNVLDGVTAGTVAASKAIVVDSNKDIASFRNITLTGELDAATLDISGDVDIDGTLETDNLTVGGAQGSDGQVLTSTGSGVAWETPSSFNADAAQTFNDRGAAVDFMIEGDNEQNLFFVDGSADKIGMGTSSPGATLHINTSTNSPMLVESTHGDGGYIELQLSDISSTPGSLTGYIGDSEALVGSGAAGDLAIRAQADFVVSSGGNSERFKIQSDGAIGINNSAPVAKLDIIGSGYEDIRLGSNRTDNTNKTAGITSYMYTNNTVSVFQVFNQNGNNAVYYGSADGAHRGLQNHYWYVNAGYNATSDHRLAMQMNSSGGILMKSSHQGDTIGNLNVSSQFGSSPNTSENALIIVQNGGQKVQIMAWAGLGARVGTRTSGWNSNSGGNCYLTGQDATNIILTSGGSPTLANGTAISSDKRLKENIYDMSNGQLDKINLLRPRTFTWKDPRKAGHQEGFIAQEVETVIPEAVEERTSAPDPEDTSRDFEGDIKVLKHEVINARLVKAVQELNEKLGSKDDTIAALEKRIETIEQRLI